MQTLYEGTLQVHFLLPRHFKHHYLIQKGTQLALFSHKCINLKALLSFYADELMKSIIN